jgi:hypothetical protein
MVDVAVLSTNPTILILVVDSLLPIARTPQTYLFARHNSTIYRQGYFDKEDAGSNDFPGSMRANGRLPGYTSG